MSSGPAEALTSDINDPTNVRIVAVSEDGIDGWVREPFAEIAKRADVPESVVIERLRAMLEAGTIRRVRQHLKSANLAQGAVVAWKVPKDCLEFAFTYMAKDDPFSGNVVVRTADADSPGSTYQLWSTLRVPQGYSIQKHCQFLKEQVGAVGFRTMPAKRLFAKPAGVHRQRGAEPGARTDEPGRVIGVNIVDLSDLDWRVLTALKRDFKPNEIHSDPWRPRARDAGESLDEFVRVAQSLDARGVLGRFSTSPELAKPSASAARSPRFNALFHWRVPEGMEVGAGKEIIRHHVITHAYWRDAGPEFGNVNLMAVAYGIAKESVEEHKFLIDEHLREAGIPILYTNVFWGGRSELKSSEISPVEYAAWCRRVGCNPRDMKTTTSNE